MDALELVTCGGHIDLDLDRVLQLSLTPGNPYFLGTIGSLDAAGKATATFVVPNEWAFDQLSPGTGCRLSAPGGDPEYAVAIEMSGARLAVGLHGSELEANWVDVELLLQLTRERLPQWLSGLEVVVAILPVLRVPDSFGVPTACKPAERRECETPSFADYRPGVRPARAIEEREEAGGVAAAGVFPCSSRAAHLALKETRFECAIPPGSAGLAIERALRCAPTAGIPHSCPLVAAEAEEQRIDPACGLDLALAGGAVRFEPLGRPPKDPP